MIEATIIEYLNNADLSATVYGEQPANKLSEFYVIEKTGGGLINHIPQSTFAVQSYAQSRYRASMMNDEVKAAMLDLITLDDVSSVELNSDYDYTDTASKTYRYQAVFVVTHY